MKASELEMKVSNVPPKNSDDVLQHVAQFLDTAEVLSSYGDVGKTLSWDLVKFTQEIAIKSKR